jgi:hypothetical protein
MEIDRYDVEKWAWIIGGVIVVPWIAGALLYYIAIVAKEVNKWLPT